MISLYIFISWGYPKGLETADFKQYRFLGDGFDEGFIW